MRYRSLPARIALFGLGFGVLVVACGGRYQTTRALDDDSMSGGNSGSGMSSAGQTSSVSSQAGASLAGSPSSAGPSSAGSNAAAATGGDNSGGGGTGGGGTGGGDTGGGDTGGHTCEMGKQTYLERRAEIAKKFASGCSSGDDCQAIVPSNACEHGCNFVPVWSGTADSLRPTLSDLANMLCLGCAGGHLSTCVPPSPPLCVNGQCTY
ncbi:MAG TPA: hypothetical protein VFK05_27680 [Polyangiaceae bacterium]|nr:hypothetical protein [Polyangiaceae bacterium]